MGNALPINLSNATLFTCKVCNDLPNPSCVQANSTLPLPADGGALFTTPTDQSAAQLPVSPARIEEAKKWLLTWLQTNEAAARTVTKPIWQSYDAELTAYEGAKKVIEGKTAAVDDNYIPETHAIADQVDDTAALMYDRSRQGGDMYKFAATESENQHKAQNLKAILDAEFRHMKCDSEWQKCLSRYSKFDISGLKTCYGRRVKYEFKTQEISAEPYTDQALIAKGYDPDPETLKQALFDELAYDGYRFVSPGIPDKFGNPIGLIVESAQETHGDHIYFRAINPRRMAFSSRGRTAENQHSIHEYWYWTKDELADDCYGFYDLDKMEKVVGSSTAQSVPDPSAANNASKPEQISSNFQTLEIVESWCGAPWKAMNRAGFSEQELSALLQSYGCDPLELKLKRAKWCFFHHSNIALLKMYRNYEADPSCYPYRLASYIQGEDTLDGQAFMIRLSSWNAMQIVALALTFRNIQRNLNQTPVLANGTGINLDDLKKCLKRGDPVVLNGNMDVNDMCQFLTIPDMSQVGFRLAGYADGKMKDNGVPAVLQGKSDAETATQETISQRSGQTGINFGFGRIVEDVLVPTIQACAEMVLARFTDRRKVEMLGEKGVLMEKFISPEDFNTKVRVQHVASLDFAEGNTKNQILMGLSNIFRPLITPPQMQAIMEMVLENGRFDRPQIERIRQSAGSMTDQMQELEAMIASPLCEPIVRPDDDHIQHMQVLLMERVKRPEIMEMPNVNKHAEMHIAALDMNAMLGGPAPMPPGAPAATPEGGEGSGPVKGPGKQIPKNQPQGEEGAVRSMANMNSPADMGMETNSGMTGRGAPPKVKGAPAGI